MKKLLLIHPAALGMASLLISACSQLPQEKIDAANGAFQTVKDSGAEIYMIEEFLAINDTLDYALNLVEAQKSKIFKNYRAAEVQLDIATRLGHELTDQVEARKEAMQREIRATVDEVIALIETSRKLILEAPRGKEGAQALLEISKELNNIEEDLGDYRSTLELGEYLRTLEKVRASKEEAESINRELKDVMTRYRKNPRG